MIRFQPFPLWVGHVGDCRDFGRLADAGIEAVVQLAIEEPLCNLPREFLVFRIPLLDGAGNPDTYLRLAVETTASLLRSRIPTLVCCGAGASRSPAIAACAVALVENRHPGECLGDLRDFHETDVSPGLWETLLALR